MPPRIMFRLSQRPKGLEFPSCGPCNQGTSRLDVVASFMARTFPGISNSADESEWERVIREVDRVAPELRREMWMPEDEMQLMLKNESLVEPGLAALRANGPVLGAHMQAFAAKIGFALHYEASGTFVPAEGRVQVRWFTSSEVYHDQLPASLKASIQEVQLMRQGKITSLGDFEYGWGTYVERADLPIYYARVRDAFVVAAFVAGNEEALPFPADEIATFAPGDLAEIPVDRIQVEHR